MYIYLRIRSKTSIYKFFGLGSKITITTIRRKEKREGEKERAIENKTFQRLHKTYLKKIICI